MEKRGFAGLPVCEKVDISTLFQPIDKIREFLCAGNDVIIFWVDRTTDFKTSDLLTFLWGHVSISQLSGHKCVV